MIIDIPKDVKNIILKLEDNGFEGYIVGGCVRDSLIGRIPKDWDISTNSEPSDILKIFDSFKVLTCGLKHGTITIIVNGCNYDVTTFRIDGDYIGNRHPLKVEFTNSLSLDLSRRDFTINAIAYNEEKGIIDPFNGYIDLFSKTIRSVGEADKRFNEDALRMLRAVRFSTELDFTIDKNTKESIIMHSRLLSNISKERIRDEFSQILVSQNPSKGIRLLVETKLIDEIIPEFRQLIGFNQHNPYHDKDVFEHTLTVLDNTKSDLILRLSALLHDIAKPQCFSLDENNVGHFYDHHNKGVELTKTILRNLKYDNLTIEETSKLIKEHMIKFHNLTMKSVKRLVNRIGSNNMDRLIELLIADIKGGKPPHDLTSVENIRDTWNKIVNEKHPLTVKCLPINGNDLKKLGLEEGKDIGIILGKLLEIVLENPELNEKDYLISEALKIIKTYNY